MKTTIKTTEKRESQKLLFIYRSLIIIFIIFGIIFIGGTIQRLFFHTGVPNSSPTNTYQEAEGGQIFTGIGPNRVSTADFQPGMVIIYVTFMYYPEDRAFSEELVLRVTEFRQIIRDYFGSFPVSELKILSEDKIKAELLNQFNAILRLGQIEALYFSDFLVVE